MERDADSILTVCPTIVNQAPTLVILQVNDKLLSNVVNFSNLIFLAQDGVSCLWNTDCLSTYCQPGNNVCYTKSKNSSKLLFDMVTVHF